VKKIAIALVLSLLAGPALAQTWQCFSGSVACAPGSPNCTCTPVAQPPLAPPTVPMTVAPIVPNCPIMSFWNGVTCQVPAAPAIDPSWYYQQQLILQQQQEQQRQEWRQREQWRQQHPEVPGGDHGGDHH
jgi:hypothetical protein